MTLSSLSPSAGSGCSMGSAGRTDAMETCQSAWGGSRGACSAWAQLGRHVRACHLGVHRSSLGPFLGSSCTVDACIEDSTGIGGVPIAS